MANALRRLSRSSSRYSWLVRSEGHGRLNPAHGGSKMATNQTVRGAIRSLWSSLHACRRWLPCAVMNAERRGCYVLSIKKAGDTDRGRKEPDIYLESKVMLATVRIALRMQTSRRWCVAKPEKLL
ncbi:cold shock domain protein 3 [Striga asiatica]|uniref:Cold shock domain protein 3 n=1 Tax=Striga asiatica TaxID=4170 RepID=A0A5A7P014_STRAF|nr:cold shock domain protein 3 [Striga asiatica]